MLRQTVRQKAAAEALTTETGKPFTFGKPAQAFASDILHVEESEIIV